MNPRLPTVAELREAGVDATAILRKARNECAATGDAAGVAECERLHREVCGVRGVDYFLPENWA